MFKASEHDGSKWEQIAAVIEVGNRVDREIGQKHVLMLSSSV